VYHGLPVVIALTVVVLFLAAFFLTSSYLLSVIIAAAPSALPLDLSSVRRTITEFSR
jgi:hypothetical protein